MDILRINTNTLTHSAIVALKNAYEQCSDNDAKESIIDAFKAIIQLQYNSEKYFDIEEIAGIDCDFDPDKYCALV